MELVYFWLEKYKRNLWSEDRVTEDMNAKLGSNNKNRIGNTNTNWEIVFDFCANYELEEHYFFIKDAIQKHGFFQVISIKINLTKQQ